MSEDAGRSPKCPVCGKLKYWEKPEREGQRYNQCQNCLSIINMSVLAARLKRKASTSIIEDDGKIAADALKGVRDE